MIKKECSLWTLLVAMVLVSSCEATGGKNLIVGEWNYERMTTGPLRTNADTLAHALAHQLYDGSSLAFYKNDSFEMLNRDTSSYFQGKGLYQLDAKNKTLTMERGVKNGVSDKMTVQLMELTKDSLKMGGPNEMLVYSRVKE